MFKNITRRISRIWNSDFPICPFIAGAFFIFYAVCLIKNLSPYLLNSNYFTDDSFQQTYPFYEAINKNIFAGDRLTEIMKGYLAPLHWGVSYGITLLTQDPILTGHIVMLLQIFLTCFFLFFAVKHYAGATPAFISITWLLHTRYLLQRMTMGLPRGWSPVIFACYFFLIAKKWHKAIFVLFFLGILASPPATFMIVVAYGMYVVFQVFASKNRETFQRILLALIILAPIYLVTTLNVIKKPDYVGDMVSFEQASKMKAFQRPNGRFPFMPLNSVGYELKTFATQAFLGRFYKPATFIKNAVIPMIFVLFILVVISGIAKKKNFFPRELWFYFLSIWIVYFLSRILAFKLYVPDRHLQFPMGFFFFLFFPIAIWRIFGIDGKEATENENELWWQHTSFKKAWQAGLGLILLVGFVSLTSGTGLYGDANFNWYKNKKGGAFEWIKNNTPEDSLIAGHPTAVDGVPLLAMRKVFITTEMSHPFYPKFFHDILNQLRISLKANYAPDLKTLVETLEPHGVDYFVFERDLFYPEKLGIIDMNSGKTGRTRTGAKFFEPLRGFAQRVSNRPWQEFAYRQLPKNVDMKKYPFMPYKDDKMVVVDLKALKKYLEAKQNQEQPNLAKETSTSKKTKN